MKLLKLNLVSTALGFQANLMPLGSLGSSPESPEMTMVF